MRSDTQAQWEQTMDQPRMDMGPEAGHKVCVVDDDPSVRNAVKRFLRAAHYTVEAFSSASEFLARGASDTYGCAILDVRMPGMDGLALQESLSARGSRLPVIFVTAVDDAGVKERAMKNGAADFFHKPVSEEALLVAVRAALSDGLENPGTRQGRSAL
jgi:FixJ family two-component response regulator